MCYKSVISLLINVLYNVGVLLMCYKLLKVVISVF